MKHHTTDHRIDLLEELYERYGKNPGISKYSINFRFWRKRTAWMFAVGGATLIKRFFDIIASLWLNALTQACPAPLIPLVNRPFIQHVVEYLVGCGFHELDIILYNQPEMIESLLEDGTRWGCRIRFHLLRDTSLVGKTIRLIHQKKQTGSNPAIRGIDTA